MTEHVDDPVAVSASLPWTWRSRAIAGVLVAAFLGGLGYLVLRRPHDDASAETPAPDVPRRGGDGIEVTPAFLASAKIVTTPATRGPLTPVVKVIGTAAFDPTHVAAVGTRAPGIVKRVLKVEGDVVKEGDLLAEVESTTLANAQADLRIAGARRHAAKLDSDRERSLLERQLTTAREVEQAEASLAVENALATAATARVQALGGGGPEGFSQLRAPVEGVVAERHISAGQSVEPSFVAFRVGDLDELWVLLTVFERHVELVRTGDAVEIRPVSDSGRVIHGKVAHVGSVLDPATRTADVRVEVDNEGLLLRPGQAVNATIHASGPARVALAVPASALTYVDGTPTVFLARTPTSFVPRVVKTGIDTGDRIEITSGLKEGDIVVSESVFALKSELFR